MLSSTSIYPSCLTAFWACYTWSILQIVCNATQIVIVTGVDDSVHPDWYTQPKKGTSLPLLLHQAQNRHISSSPMMMRIWQTSCRSPTLSPLRSLRSSQVKLPQVPPDLHVLHNPYINFTSCDPSTGCQVSNGNRISSMRFQLAMTWKASLMRKSSPQQPTTMMNGLVLTCRVSLIPVEDWCKRSGDTILGCFPNTAKGHINNHDVLPQYDCHSISRSIQALPLSSD